MRKLGYIVSDRKFNNVKDFVEVVNDISLADLSKPTLLVGLELAKKNVKNFSILDRKNNGNLFWTFKKTERRVDFENDIDYFYNYIINNIINNIKYYYINILKLRYTRIKKLYNIVFSSERKYIYISNNMIYVLYDGAILGVSLEMLEYINIPREKVLSKLYSNKNNVICTNSSECVKCINHDIGNKKYAVPYFMSML